MANNYERIEKDFTYYRPTQGQPEKYEAIRGEAKSLAHLIDKLVPDGREKSIAFNKLREAVMWANAGIAVGGEVVEDDILEHRDIEHRSWDDLPRI